MRLDSGFDLEHAIAESRRSSRQYPAAVGTNQAQPQRTGPRRGYPLQRDSKQRVTVTVAGVLLDVQGVWKVKMEILRGILSGQAKSG